MAVAQREEHGYEGYDSYGTSQRITGAADGFASLEEVSACNPLPGGGRLRGWGGGKVLLVVFKRRIKGDLSVICGVEVSVYGGECM